MVSAVAESVNGETVYLAKGEFIPDERVVFGMSVLVNIGEEASPEVHVNVENYENKQSSPQNENSPGRRRSQPDSENSEHGE